MIYMKNGTRLDVEGLDTYKLDLVNDILVLKLVLFVLGTRGNLISVSALIKNS